MRAVDQQLLGHATANDAGAADAIFLRHRDLRAMGRRHAGSPHAARSRADDEQVEVVVAHISLRCIAPAYGASTSEARRVGKEMGMQDSSRVLPSPKKKN